MNEPMHSAPESEASGWYIALPALVVWQWYLVNGHLKASDLKAKVYSALSRFAGPGDDSDVSIVYAHNKQGGDGEAMLEVNINGAWPEIERVLRRTRKNR